MFSPLISGIAQPTPEDVDKLYTEVNRGAAVVHLVWILWSIVQSHLHSSDTSPNAFNYMEYSVARYRHYKILKEKFCSH